MNIVNKLTLKHLRQNKRRTLVTIIGVIISVAMVTAVSTLVVSFMDMMERQTIATEGEWHILYKDVDKDQIEMIKDDDEIETVVLSKDLGYSKFEESVSPNKPYLFITGYSEQGFKQFPVELSEGRFPQAEGEVVISEEIAENDNVNYTVGDVVKLEVGERYSEEEEALDQTYSLAIDEDGEIDEELKGISEKNFTIVGTIKQPSWMEYAWSPGYTVIGYIDENTLSPDEKVNVAVAVKKVKRSLFTHAEELGDKISVESVQFNDPLLRYYGITQNDGMNKTLNSLAAIIMVIIMVGSVSLIYNAFAISVSDRSRHLGMLSSVGATRKQKRNSVLFEGFIIGVISIPIGVFSGLLGIGITFIFINSMINGALGVTEKLTVTVTPLSILVACVVSAMTIFISAYIPAKRASKISAIDAIRQTADLKLTRRAVKTSKWVRKLFGMEAEIGLKNLKRNKRRYQATVFSLVISIVLFLSVSFFTDNLKKSLELSQDGVNFDLMVYLPNENDDQLVNTIVELNDVTKYNLIKELGLASWVHLDQMADELPIMDGDEAYPYFIQIQSLNDENLKSYAKDVHADYEQLKKGMSAIVIDTIPYEDVVNGKYAETKAIHTQIGEKIDLYKQDWETDEEILINQITVAGLTDQFPMGVQPAGLGGLNLIVSEEVMSRLVDESSEGEVQSRLYLNSEDPVATQQKIEEIEEVKHSIYNAYQQRQQEEQMIMLMSVFTYGFILLISAISVANIFNTISTSISLRKREFAMLKSLGMTPKGFSRMLNYESIFYGIKSLVYGLPLSFIAMYFMHQALGNSFSYNLELPWVSIIYVIIAVFVIVGSSMLYSSAKVKKENIIDAIKQESI